MSETRQTAGRAAGSARYPTHGGTEPTGWVGWVFFAGVMMITVGAFQAMMGLVALFNNDYFLVTRNGLVVSVNYTTWGWVHLILGAVVLFAGLGVMAGQMWARVIGVILAVLSGIVNIAFLAAYPIWSALIIALDVIVIYALVVHGREAAHRDY